ncbi:MAG TPA: hypothetical protein VH353_12100 [Caulobacteraceae bacterium]|jgi:hypothetical protein|nr:hypothetical protein [Caulobacteraceae bacterium]
MSNARLAGLVGALAAYAGGSGAWAVLTPDHAMAAVTFPSLAAPDLDLATLREAEARAAPVHLAASASASADPSKTPGGDPVLNPRDVQPVGRPSPTSWLLLVIGVGMIGGALRGFIVANRALARLQPDERD